MTRFGEIVASVISILIFVSFIGGISFLVFCDKQTEKIQIETAHNDPVKNLLLDEKLIELEKRLDQIEKKLDRLK